MSRLLIGDCRDSMRQLIAEGIRVQMCVTSPPYWGLRDYGVAGQFGLEPTIKEYVDNMVEVFGLVRELLADDGTLWLNLGSSYAGSGMGGGGSFASERRGWRDGVDASGRTPFRPPSRVPACGSDGKELLSYRQTDSACFDLCDGCRDSLSMGNENTSQRLESGALPPSQTSRDTSHMDCASASLSALPLCALASTIAESSSLLSVECSHCANCGACLSVLRSSTRDARLCVRMAKSRSGIEQRVLGGRNQDRDALGMAWVNYTFKPKDMVPVPWMVAMALQADGWWLRQDIIWHKPNPMPESVRDRCTKAHEYLFLLAKSERYLCDMDAVREKATAADIGSMDGGAQRLPDGSNANDGRNYRGPGNVNPPKGQLAYESGDERHRTKAGLLDYAKRQRSPAGWDTGDGAHGTIHRGGRAQKVEYTYTASFIRNKRSVWTVATQPYSEAHFATYPPALIEPCILAGSKPGDIVFDPFFGSGTTGEVAQRLGRKWIGCELSPEYAKLAERRTSGTVGMVFA